MTEFCVLKTIVINWGDIDYVNGLFCTVEDEWQLTTADLLIATENAGNMPEAKQLSNFKHMNLAAQWVL